MRDEHERLRGNDGNWNECIRIEAKLCKEVLADHERPLRR